MTTLQPISTRDEVTGSAGVPPAGFRVSRNPPGVCWRPSRNGRSSHVRRFRRGRPNRQAGRPPYPRESATLQSTLPNSKADAYHGEAHTAPRPAADFWNAYDAWKARQK